MYQYDVHFYSVIQGFFSSFKYSRNGENGQHFSLLYLEHQSKTCLHISSECFKLTF